MEVPCSFCFVGNGGELKKLKSFFKTTPIGSDNNGNFIERNYFTVSFPIVKGTAKNAKVFHHEQFAIYSNTLSS